MALASTSWSDYAGESRGRSTGAPGGLLGKLVMGTALVTCAAAGLYAFQAVQFWQSMAPGPAPVSLTSIRPNHPVVASLPVLQQNAELFLRDSLPFSQACAAGCATSAAAEINVARHAGRFGPPGVARRPSGPRLLHTFGLQSPPPPALVQPAAPLQQSATLDALQQAVTALAQAKAAATPEAAPFQQAVRPAPAPALTPLAMPTPAPVPALTPLAMPTPAAPTVEESPTPVAASPAPLPAESEPTTPAATAPVRVAPSVLVPLPTAMPTVEPAPIPAPRLDRPAGPTTTVTTQSEPPLAELTPPPLHVPAAAAPAIGRHDGVAVYDITAATVYMPDGSRLEAHSGLGYMTDNPRFVDRRNTGSTPPGAYNLVRLDSLFFGVEALRMVPADSKSRFGRDGFLTHTYLLRGRPGQSNGCVVFPDYGRFLSAFKRGEVKRLVVVASLPSATTRVASASIGN